MQVHVLLSPLLRKYVPNYDNTTGTRVTIEVLPGIEQIIAKLHIPREEVTSILVNGYPGKFDSPVNEGDSVTLVKAIGGG